MKIVLNFILNGVSHRPHSPSPSPSTPGRDLELLSELAEPILFLVSRLGLDDNAELSGECSMQCSVVLCCVVLCCVVMCCAVQCSVRHCCMK